MSAPDDRSVRSSDDIDEEAVKREKRHVRRSLNRIEDELKTLLNAQTPNLPAARVCIEDFGKELRKLATLDSQLIEVMDVTGKTEAQIEKMEERVEESYRDFQLAWLKCKGLFETAYAKQQTADETASRRALLAPTSVRAEGLYPGLKAPEIRIPKFNGDLRAFMDWSNQFEAMVHRNENFEPIQKLWWLKNSLIDSAADALRDCAMTDDAYQPAWDAINRMYRNKRAIIDIHFSDIVDIPVIKVDSDAREALQKVNAAVRGLKVSGVDVKGNMDMFIAFHVIRKMDTTLRREFERSLDSNESHPKFEVVEKFLERLTFAYETTQKLATKRSERVEKTTEKWAKAEKAYKSEKVTEKKTTMMTTKRGSPSCKFCGNSHLLAFCAEFLKKSIDERWECVKQLSICFNCFGADHTARVCKSRKCKTCAKPHNSVLHRDMPANSNANVYGSSSNGSTSSEPSSSSTNAAKGSNPNVNGNESGASSTVKCNFTVVSKNQEFTVLPSAAVHVVLEDGRKILARVLLDECAESTLMSEHFAKRCKIKMKRESAFIGGITSHEIESCYSAQVAVKSRLSEFQLLICANIVPEIPYLINRIAGSEIMEKWSDLELADPSNLIRYDDVDMLLGVKYVNECFLAERQNCGSLWIKNSHFGWVSSGVVELSRRPVNSSKFAGLIVDIEAQLRRFWEIEEVSVKPDVLAEHERCAEFVQQTMKRNEAGEFVATLPFKEPRERVAKTFKQAFAALRRIETRLSPQLKTMYNAFMKEYIELGHMEKVPANQVAVFPTYYLPHHGVVRMESLTTKLRAVFNASAKNSTGCSLNEALMIGPKLQPDLFDTLLRFRMHEIAFTADVSKMYRCVRIRKEDQDMQRILWRDAENEPIQIYRLTTLTYGTAPASYIATKCLLELAKSIENEFPEEAESIRSEFYMDDLMSGAPTVEKAIEKQKIVHSTLAKAKFLLAKYASNSKEFLEKIDVTQNERKMVEIVDEENVSALGLRWIPAKDQLRVKIRNFDLAGVKFSRRNLLSILSRIFDPLGILAPVTITGKILLQDLWREGPVSWDEETTTEIQEKFRGFCEKLSDLSQFFIPRFAVISNVKTFQIIGFCDASKSAYCAVVYLRAIERDENVCANLLCAKTKVAPIKQLTIPRLELMSAELLSKLIVRVCNVIQASVGSVHAFSDSKVVLAWIASPPTRFETFVRNRLNAIANRISAKQWAYVKSSENPADLATRGITAAKLAESKLWKFGPDWLVNEFEQNIVTDVNVPELPEQRKATANLVAIQQEQADELISRFSNFDRAMRVLAYIFRFINFRERVVFGRVDCIVTASERKRAVEKCIRMSQIRYFKEEVNVLTSGNRVKKRSLLRSLNVFLDDKQLLRVGGRLENSEYSYNVKHPIVLSVKSDFLVLYVRKLHVQTCHAPNSVIVRKVMQDYWIVGSLSKLVKRIRAQCIRCVRLKASTAQQLMGHLPPSRVNVARPFSRTGVDLTGAFQVKCTGHRTLKVNKTYAVIYVCMVTKAVHIELATDLSTEAFLATFERFVSRRGVVNEVNSDNATNFVGLFNVMQRSKVVEYAASKGITWNFIDPRSPHQGGLWEAAVKSAKSLLKRAIGEQLLTRDELHTILVRIEAILNSRPLCLFRGQENFEPLTPSHLLIGSALDELPIAEAEHLSMSSRHNLVRSIIKAFWSTWATSYLSQLQRRTKWKDVLPNVQIGTIVFVKAVGTSPLQWPKAVIVEVCPDKEGQVRSVKVRLSSGVIMKRSIHQLILLLTE